MEAIIRVFAGEYINVAAASGRSQGLSKLLKEYCKRGKYKTSLRFGPIMNDKPPLISLTGDYIGSEIARLRVTYWPLSPWTNSDTFIRCSSTSSDLAEDIVADFTSHSKIILGQYDLEFHKIALDYAGMMEAFLSQASANGEDYKEVLRRCLEMDQVDQNKRKASMN